jgi:hypothetical protein
MRMASCLFLGAVIVSCTINTITIFWGTEALRDLLPREPLFVLLVFDSTIDGLWETIGMIAMWRWLRKES